MKMFPFALIAALMIPAAAMASNCPNLMAEVDAALAAKPDLDKEALVDEESNKNLSELRAEGEAAHKAGEHGESVELLQKALMLIKNAN